MSDAGHKTLELKIHGMHCASCDILVERNFKNVAGVERVKANYATGKAELQCSRTPSLGELNEAIRPHGYSVSLWADRHSTVAPEENKKKHYLEIGAVFLIVVALYVIFKQLDLIPKNFAISEGMSLGFVVLIGLVASVSTCMAVTGGLLLAVAGKYNELNPHLEGYRKFRPHLFFNGGRMVSYTVFGGVVGGIGSALSFSSSLTGIVTIAVSIVMIILGLQILKLFPWLRRFQFKMPKFIAHKIHEAAGKDLKAAPFLLGASTFFFPCGFTQALQLYVLSKGDIWGGALTMFLFALGTAPALIGVSAISSFSKGAFQRYFLKFAGVLVIIIGLFNINNGLALSGSSVNLASLFQKNGAGDTAQSVDPNVVIENGKQVVDMAVIGYQYSPYRFTVYRGMPVEWRIDGSQASGCAQVITVPKLGITEYLPQGVKTIEFTPEQTGTIQFSCTMGMTTPGAAFIVVDAPAGSINQNSNTNTKPSPTRTCNPEIMDCVDSQKVTMEISQQRGFYPNEFTIKKSIPVEMTIDAKIQLTGCMGTMVIPKYNLAHKLTLGISKLTFTPTETGTVLFTCSMGKKLGQFTVVS